MDQTAIKRVVALVQSNNYDQALKLVSQHLKRDARNQLMIQLKADIYRRMGEGLKSADIYREAALAGGTHSASCWYNAAVQYQKENKLADAVAAYKCAIDLNPQHSSSRNNLCVMLYQQNRADEASQHAYWLHANTESPEHLINAGYVLRSISQYDLADNAFRRALALEPNNRKYLAAALQSAQYVCDWEWLEALKSRLMNELYLPKRFDESQELHHVHVAWCDVEEINIEMAKARTTRQIGDVSPKYDHKNHKFGNKIKVGYVSSDFFNHATLHLMIGVFEHHNKDAFEITAYCHSKDDNTPYRKRFLSAIDHFKDISNLTDDEAAELIYKDEIDILVDLKGFTDKNRLKIFARRPAPVQVTYIGFPGSSGASFFDYAITDKWVTPDTSKTFYTEKLCRLPEVYQCNDNKRPIASNQLTRSDYKLPDNRFVFCCFNQSYKIESEIFGAWIKILLRAENSILWILDPGETGYARLESELLKNNIDPSRLILADKQAPPLHLKRIQEFADLALDTRIVNGHTTTSDALWAGVPVVTLYGKHFNSRVSASLLSAVGLEELVTYSIDEYVNKAVSLAEDKQALLSVKQRLEKNRFIKPLFDTERFTKHFESAFTLMAERVKQREIPDHIDVQKLPDRKIPFMDKIEEYAIKIDPDNRHKINKQATGLVEINQTCSVCQSERSKIIRRSAFALSLDSGDLDVPANWLQCASCGHVYRSAILTEAGLEKLRVSASVSDLTRLEAFEILEEAHNALAVKSTPEETKVLDVYPLGKNYCGVAVEFGYRYTGLVKTRQLAAIKKITNTAMVADLMKVNVSGVPDVIHLGNYLERVLNPKNVLGRIAAILDKGGVLTLCYSNCASLAWVDLNENKTCKVWDEPNHVNIYRRAQLVQIIQGCDFDFVSAKPLASIDAGMALVFRKK